MPRLISGTNFRFTSRTSFTSLCLSQSILLRPSLKTHLLVNPFRHRSLTIDNPDRLPRLMGPVLIGFLGHGFSCGRLN